LQVFGREQIAAWFRDRVNGAVKLLFLEPEKRGIGILVVVLG
jgi:hypothetical protein